MSGLVARIQRFSTTNGPGIRSTVFLKGCPLSCRWCHNPEMQSFRPELLLYSESCVRCGLCMKACAHEVHAVTAEAHVLNRANCILCGECAEDCPKEAIELCGKRMEVPEVMDIVRRDAVFYRNTNGGVTFSGGEPLSQFEFTRELLRSCHAEGFHTCVDTSGFGGRAAELVPYADLFLWDIKETDPENHLRMTGVALEPILESLRETDRLGGKFFIRCPVIPGVNDREEHLVRVGELVCGLRGVQQVDLVPYHDLGLVKASAAGIPQESFRKLTAERKETLLQTIKEVTAVPVSWTS